MPTAANPVIVLGNAARDRGGPAAARVQGLLMAGLDVATGCPRDDDYGVHPGVGVVARAGDGAEPAAADRFATALQAGILLAMLAPAPSPRDRTDVGGTSRWTQSCCGTSAPPPPPYEERIEVQKFNLFEGRSRPAAARSLPRTPTASASPLLVRAFRRP